MNQTTVDLARKSGLKKHPSEDREYIGDFDWRLFATLIVEESIEVMVKYDYHGEWLGEKLKEHFGINTKKQGG